MSTVPNPYEPPSTPPGRQEPPPAVPRDYPMRPQQAHPSPSPQYGYPAPAPQYGYPPPAPQYGYPPPVPYAHAGYAVQPRSPILFALASLLIGGLGTMLAGRVGRGLVILGIMFFNGFLIFIPFLGFLFILVAVGLWVFSGIDGYRTAQHWNQQHGIVS